MPSQCWLPVASVFHPCNSDLILLSRRTRGYSECAGFEGEVKGQSGRTQMRSREGLAVLIVNEVCCFEPGDQRSS